VGPYVEGKRMGRGEKTVKSTSSHPRRPVTVVGEDKQASGGEGKESQVLRVAKCRPTKVRGEHLMSDVRVESNTI